jgi:hypothetical protein
MLGFVYETVAGTLIRKTNGAADHVETNKMTVDFDDYLKQVLIYADSEGVSRVVFATTKKVMSCGRGALHQVAHALEAPEGYEIVMTSGFSSRGHISKLSLYITRRASKGSLKLLVQR